MKEFHSISAFGGRPPRQGAIDGGKATEAIETDLGTVGSEAAGPDLTILQPALKARATASGVEIDWGWSGFGDFLDAVLIQVDRGDTQGWRLLVHDTTPGYKDTAPPPAALARWTYPRHLHQGRRPGGFVEQPRERDSAGVKRPGLKAGAAAAKAGRAGG